MIFHVLLFVHSLLFVTHIALKPIFSDETPSRDNYSTMTHSVKHCFNLFVNEGARRNFTHFGAYLGVSMVKPEQILN